MLPPRAITHAEAAFDVQNLREHWRVHGFGHWAVEEKESGRFIGRTGIKRHPDWPLDPDNTEFGWLYDRAVWGRGYATEAALEVVRFCFEELGRPEVISIAHPENARVTAGDGEGRALLRRSASLGGAGARRGLVCGCYLG